MIEVVNLQKTYPGTRGTLSRGEVRALRGVSLGIARGGALALIGESGCGKTTLGRIVTGLESHTGGEVLIDGAKVSDLPVASRRAQFRKVQLIHQDPYAALNPTRTIANALFDPLRLQARRSGKDQAWIERRAVELLRLVGLDASETLYKYPHQLSGGQRQRVVIARALTVEPEALVADEAVSMIDVSLRLGVLNLLSQLRKELNISIIFITHDVAAARYVAQGGLTAVIYRGEIVEMGPTDDLIQRPVHPYTQSLLSAVPVLHGLETEGPDRFIPRPSEQDEARETTGCLFAERCPFADDGCRTQHPEPTPWDGVPDTRQVACFKPHVRKVVAVPIAVGAGESAHDGA